MIKHKLHPRDSGMVHPTQINKCNSSQKQTERQKPHDHLNGIKVNIKT